MYEPVCIQSHWNVTTWSLFSLWLCRPLHMYSRSISIDYSSHKLWMFWPYILLQTPSVHVILAVVMDLQNRTARGFVKQHQMRLHDDILFVIQWMAISVVQLWTIRRLWKTNWKACGRKWLSGGFISDTVSEFVWKAYLPPQSTAVPEKLTVP